MLPSSNVSNLASNDGRNDNPRRKLAFGKEVPSDKRERVIRHIRTSARVPFSILMASLARIYSRSARMRVYYRDKSIAFPFPRWQKKNHRTNEGGSNVGAKSRQEKTGSGRKGGGRGAEEDVSGGTNASSLNGRTEGSFRYIAYTSELSPFFLSFPFSYDSFRVSASPTPLLSLLFLCSVVTFEFIELPFGHSSRCSRPTTTTWPLENSALRRTQHKHTGEIMAVPDLRICTLDVKSAFASANLVNRTR